MRAKLRSAFVAVLVIFATATALAQRGGYRSQSYSGNLPYDGKFQFVRISYPWYGRQGAPWARNGPIASGVVRLASIECDLDLDEVFRDPLGTR